MESTSTILVFAMALGARPAVGDLWCYFCDSRTNRSCPEIQNRFPENLKHCPLALQDYGSAYACFTFFEKRESTWPKERQPVTVRGCEHKWLSGPICRSQNLQGARGPSCQCAYFPGCNNVPAPSTTAPRGLAKDVVPSQTWPRTSGSWVLLYTVTLLNCFLSK